METAAQWKLRSRNQTWKQLCSGSSGPGTRYGNKCAGVAEVQEHSQGNRHALVTQVQELDRETTMQWYFCSQSQTRRHQLELFKENCMQYKVAHRFRNQTKKRLFRSTVCSLHRYRSQPQSHLYCIPELDQENSMYSALLYSVAEGTYIFIYIYIFITYIRI